MRLSALGVLLFTGSLSAATLTMSSGSLTATLVESTANTFIAFDVRASGIGTVSDPAPVGGVELTDNAAPVPNNLLLAFDLAFTQEVILNFNGPAAFLGPGFVVVPATGTLGPGAPVSDPALSKLLGPLLFGFTVTSVFQDPNNSFFVDSLSLSSAQTVVPEPSQLSLAFLGASMLLGLAYRSRIRK